MSHPLEDLARRIHAASAREKAERPASEGTSPTDAGGGRAFGAAIDLTAGVMVGTFIGYMIDRWIGTNPWAMIIFLFLGFGAGLVNIHRSETGQTLKIGYRQDKEADRK
jgi:ATP synthase protein I